MMKTLLLALLAPVCAACVSSSAEPAPRVFRPVPVRAHVAPARVLEAPPKEEAKRTSKRKRPSLEDLARDVALLRAAVDKGEVILAVKEGP